MIKRTDNILKLVVLAEDKKACEVGLMKKEGKKTVDEYLKSICNCGVELSHFMWARKNFQGDVGDDILFEFSKELIDRIGPKKALKRFQNNNIVLTKIEIDYFKKLGELIPVKKEESKPEVKKEEYKSEVKKEEPEPKVIKEALKIDNNKPLMWNRKNLQGKVSDEILLELTKKIIDNDNVGAKRIVKRFENNNIVLTRLEKEYIKQLN